MQLCSNVDVLRLDGPHINPILASGEVPLTISCAERDIVGERRITT